MIDSVIVLCYNKSRPGTSRWTIQRFDRMIYFITDNVNLHVYTQTFSKPNMRHVSLKIQPKMYKHDYKL